MYKILAGLVAVLLILVGLTFVAGRGGHETYDAKAFSPGPAIGILKALSDDALEGRLPGTEGNERAREIIINRMKALELLTVGGREYEHAFTFGNFAEPDAPKQTGINIIGVRQGKSDSDKVIVVTAHYDHLGIREGEIYNGADDNASGVAAMLSLAEYFGKSKNQPEHSILFVALDAEEQGLQGARALVDKPPLPRELIGFNLNLDMVSRADNATLWAVGGHQVPSVEAFLDGVLENAELPLDVKKGFDGRNEDQDDWSTMSDHFAFWSRGIPFLYLGVEDHPDYHAPTDDFERIDQDTFLKSIETIIMIAEALDTELPTILEGYVIEDNATDTETEPQTNETVQ